MRDFAAPTAKCARRETAAAKMTAGCAVGSLLQILWNGPQADNANSKNKKP